MSTFITSTVSWGGKENFDYFLKPMFIGKSPFQTQGVRIIPNIKSGQKLNYFGAASKLLKAYVVGFNAATGTTYTQRTLTTYRMKAEAADDANDFYQTVFEYATRTDDWNNMDGTILKKILQELYSNAVESDVYRQFWLSDTAKEQLTSGLKNGTADADYNAYDGMWKLLVADAALTPSATQIKRVAFSNSAVAEVDTVTLTGSSGTCNVIIGGVSYLATFDTSITVTNNNFRTLYAAALLLRDIVLSGTATIIMTSNIAGQPLPVTTVSAAITGDLTGSKADTTANTDADALASGEAEDMFLALYQGADKVLKQTPKNEKVFLVTDTVFENYETYLETLGTERSQMLLENGHTIEVLKYRGIAVINLGWDVHLDADFPSNASEFPGYPHRVIYTHIYNLVLGIDSMNQFNGTKMWFNLDEEQNRFRTKLVMGCNYVHNKMTALGY